MTEVRQQKRDRKTEPRDPARGGTKLSPAVHPGLSLGFKNDFLVVGVGASAGGLDAFRKLLDAMPRTTGMAFVFVQHLDPNHKSLLVELLAGHTGMMVVQAENGETIERDHLYVIPPGKYLSVKDGALHVSEPEARHGARLPFDFLLSSLASAYGTSSACIVLSGSGADGSLGLASISASGGLVLAQDLKEAEYDGMPQSAVATDYVAKVLKVGDMPAALRRREDRPPKVDDRAVRDDGEPLGQIIDLLHRTTSYDFALYKPGTLQRRIERRMLMASIDKTDMKRYLKLLVDNQVELDLLAKDLLIHVTSFFRDAKVFDVLARNIIPDLVSKHDPTKPLRIWVAGCSTGEETYSLAVLLQEEIEATGSSLKLQIFASDIDADAVAKAREGIYPETIEAEVSKERLARFFVKEGKTYTVNAALRSGVVFTVQDVLVDPPFSKMDFISCRNLLIYLGADAQTKVIALFEFALTQGGLLLLGNSETAGQIDGRFETVFKAERIYRKIAKSRSKDLIFGKAKIGAGRPSGRTADGFTSPRPISYSDICRLMVIENYAPASVLINENNESIYSLGPTDLFLTVVPGHPSHDILAMASAGIKTKLRTAIQMANKGNALVTVEGGRSSRSGKSISFRIEVRPILNESERLLLISFVEELGSTHTPSQPQITDDNSRTRELEQELVASKMELQSAIRNLEVMAEEHTAINEEALSVNEEFQSTNEELLTSKEELQSLNEELTALNSQLQESLDRQRTTSDDLQNVLYSTDVATLFLDAKLKIRFFTPATRALFNIIPGDIGRPLSDLNSLATDTALTADAQSVLKTRNPIDREIETTKGVWFTRRVLPYRAHDNGVEGVVITFTDVTERKRTRKALEVAKQQAELANIAKSRFLAAASHDLRQPLQTLALLQGLLAKAVADDRSKKLVKRLNETLGSMSDMLNTLLDINQIEAGVVQSKSIPFKINDILQRLRHEFTYTARAQGLQLHVVSCDLTVESDPHLLEQMIRNLLSNALKYTKHGKILVGCRRRRDQLSLEVWDTGLGIPKKELQSIFDEYHQVDNAAREKSMGLGLGLSIVQRLGLLLGHAVSVQSNFGKGSRFSIDIALAERALALETVSTTDVLKPTTVAASHSGRILIIDDDPDILELLDLSLQDAGHSTLTAGDAIVAMTLLDRNKDRLDLVLTDYNLPNGMTGLEFAAQARSKLGRSIPVMILTGDISTQTIRNIADAGCVHLNKPVNLPELSAAIQNALSSLQEPVQHPVIAPDAPAPKASADDQPFVFIVDDDHAIRALLREVLEGTGHTVEDYASCDLFIKKYEPRPNSCLLIDAYLPGMTGLELLGWLKAHGHLIPAIIITGSSDVPIAVQAMKAGAIDFIEKPIGTEELLASIANAVGLSKDRDTFDAGRALAVQQVANLTKRQHQIMDMVLAGQPNKNIAADLGISQRTVENHRATMMRKTGSKSLPALARLAIAAASSAATASVSADVPSPAPPAKR